MNARVKAFHKLLTPDQARQAYAQAFAPKPLGSQQVPLGEALGRVLAQEVRAETDLPSFDRSTVDGYAVRAADTVQAAAGKPASLKVITEVFMGVEGHAQIHAGETARIPTGGPLPPGTDAVVMQEHIVRQDGAISVERPLKVGENVTPRAADFHAGEVVLSVGRTLRAAEVGLLAGMGQSTVDVYVRPRVGILVTGDEIVPPGERLGPTQVYDMNTYTLAALVTSAGGVAYPYGIVRDNLGVLARAVQRAHEDTDALVVVGGSSVGEKDVAAEAITTLGEPGIIVHGISIRPGKPTILAVANRKPVFGLPGNPVSAMVVFDAFVRPVVKGMAGVHGADSAKFAVRARIATRLVAGDREDHVRVALRQDGTELVATPVPGGSGVITSMVRADGIVVVPARSTVEPGTEVEVKQFD